MNLKPLNSHKFYRPMIGAGLTALCGLALWAMPLGEGWVNASYDYLFRFGARPVTNRLAIIRMDNAAFQELGQTRPQWDRRLHAQLLSKLTEDRCPLVVFDVFFRTNQEVQTDMALADAIRRHGRVVLMDSLTDPTSPGNNAAAVATNVFHEVAAGHGIGRTDTGLGETGRRHWPFPATGEGDIQSLAWTAARLAGANLNPNPGDQWLRYYGEHGGWTAMSYHLALSNAPGYFRDKTVFIGRQPEKSDLHSIEDDKFRTPYSRWTGEAAGGVEIMATTFLNLVNRDWLRRPPWWVEALLILFAGAFLGGGLCEVSSKAACWLAAGIALAVTLGAVCWSYFTNFWFPWLVIAGGQLPCALAWSIGVRMFERYVLNVGDYEWFDPPFGEGEFGKVLLARNVAGQWQALKVVYKSKFGQDRTTYYELEFRGVKRFKPISGKHAGLVQVDFVSRLKSEGYFYYVMELGDPIDPDWNGDPRKYQPRDLGKVRALAEGRRLPVRDCVRIGIVLADALAFLHRRGLTHRDIKPANIIFVDGQPKLGDVGAVGEVRPPGEIKTLVGTPGYMPPLPEPPGTVQADVYALGMVLYVISTGQNPDFFPGLSTTLAANQAQPDFMTLNPVILKACQPDCTQRFASANELHAALLAVQERMEDQATTQ